MSIKAKTKRRITFLVIAMLVIAGLGAGAVVYRKQRDTRRLERLRVEGLAAAKEGRSEEAVLKLTEYLGRYWSDLDVLAVYVKERPKVNPKDPGTVGQTINALRRVLELDPKRLEERQSLLELYANYGFTTEMIDTANTILKDHKDDARALQHKTTALARLRKFEEALNIANDWCAVEPLNVRSHMAALALMEDLRRPNDRIIERVENLKLPARGDARRDLLEGYAHSLTADYDTAKKLLQDAANKPPVDADFAGILVQQLNELGLYDDSLKQLQKLSKLKGEEQSKQTIKALVRRHWESNRPKDVIQFTDDLDLKDPNVDVEMIALRALALRQDQQPDKSDALKAELASKQADPVAQAWSVVLEQGADVMGSNPKKLMDVCEKALSTEPRNTYLRFFLGEAYAQLSENELAINQWKRVKVENATWYLPLVRLSAVQLESKSYGNALLSAREAVQRSPSAPAGVLNLARVWFANIEQGKVSGADDLLKLVDQVQEQLPKEEYTLPIQVSLLCRTARKEQGSAALKKALARPELTESTLLQLAAVSSAYNLGLEDECFAKLAKTSGGVTSAAAYSRAVNLLLRGSAAEGLAFLQGAKEKSPTKDDLQWKLLLARYLDLMQDPKAKDEWIALGDANPENLVVQQSAMESPGARADRGFMDRTIERVKSLTPGEGTRWRTARARWMMSGASSQQDLERAAQLLNDVIQKAPTSGEARFMLAQVLERLGKIDPAINELNAAANQDPGNNQVALYLARLLQAKNEFDKARAILDRVAQAQSTSADQRRQAALLRAQGGDTAGALELLKKTDEDDAGSGRSELLKAVLYRQRNELDKAEAICQKLLEKPDAVIVQFAADLYASQGKMQEAEKALALLEKIEQKPGTRDLLLADFYSRYVGPEEALKHFKNATLQAPSSVVTWRALAVYCASLGKADDAIAAVQSGLKASPGDANLAALQSEAETLKAAIDDLQLRALAVLYFQRPVDAPAAADAIKVVLNGRRDNRNLEQVTADLRKIADANLQLWEIQEVTTRLYMKIGKYDDAASVVMRAVQTFPTQIVQPRMAYEVLAAAGRWGEAKNVAEVWRNRAPANAMFADVAIARALIRLKLPKDAVAQLRPYMATAMASPDPSGGIILEYVLALISADQSEDAANLLWPLAQKDPVWRKHWMHIVYQAPLSADQTVQWLERVRTAIPPNAAEELSLLGETWNGAAVRLKKQEFVNKSIEVLQPIVERPDAPVSALVAMAIQCEGALKDEKRAEELYRRAIKGDPKTVVALNNLAMILLKRGEKLDEARELATAATQAEPNIPTLHDTLALILAKQRSYDAAVASLRQALRLDPGSVEWRLHLGEILLESGRRQEAKRVETEITALPGSLTMPPDQQKRLDALRADLEKATPKTLPKQVSLP